MAPKVLCSCYNTLVSRKVERAHRVHAHNPYSYLTQSTSKVQPKLRGVSSPSASSVEEESNEIYEVGQVEDFAALSYEENLDNEMTQTNDEESIYSDPEVEDSDADAGSAGGEDLDSESSEDEANLPDWDTFEYPATAHGISGWDSLGEAYEQEAAAVGE